MSCKVIELIAFRTSLIAIRSLIDCDTAIYSAFIGFNMIWVWSLDTHCNGTATDVMRYSVLDLTEIEFCLCSMPNNPAKSAYIYNNQLLTH